MEPRGWWTVGLTALAGPLGAVAGAFVLYTVGGSFCRLDPFGKDR